MTTGPQLVFLKNEAGEEEGLADAGIETFRDSPYASCAREAGQNARDAADTLPVRVTFNVERVRTRDFPAFNELVDSLQSCAKGTRVEKEREFFANAMAIVGAQELPVLVISDSNTKGLIGPPDEPGTPFHSLVKATGVSTKESATSGGSFGIGKNASFAVSDLQMVLYATRYVDSKGQQAVAAQGKIKLCSHADSQGALRRATGYWGDPNGFRAITDDSEIPEWMRRSQKGTSIFSVGFRKTENWAAHMTSSLVSNFFAAVHRHEMEFEVGAGEFLINRNTIEGLLCEQVVHNAAEAAGRLPDFEFAAKLFRALVSPNAVTDTIAIEGLGRIGIRILIEPGLPRRVGFIRNGMLITDNLQYFGHPLSRFPGSRDFVAIVEPEDEEAARLLKRLENPAHDNFSAERIADPEKRLRAEAVMKKLGKRLREIIKTSTGSSSNDSVILDELGRFFAAAGPTQAPPDEQGEKDPEQHVFMAPQKIRRRATSKTPTDGEDGGRPGTGTGGGGHGGGVGPLEGSGSGGRGKRGTKSGLQLSEMRNLVPRHGDSQAEQRLILFTPSNSGKARIRVQATGIDKADDMLLIASDSGSIDHGELLIEVRAGVRKQVLVRFDHPYVGPIELVSTIEP